MSRWLAAMIIVSTSAAAAEERIQSAADLIATLQPAVVNLSVTKHTKTGDEANAAGQVSIAEVKVQSSGFIIDPAGVIVTNQHVIADATEIIVVLHDMTRLRATVLAAAAHSDIALLTIHAGKAVPSLHFGDSDRLRPGDPVLLIGNPVGLGSTVTAGIVSALDRVMPDSEAGSFFQVDAPLNVGNSGGPVFNMAGEVVGVSTALITAGKEGGSVGLGFAIPSDETRLTVDHLMAEGHDALGWIGIHVQPVPDEIAAAVGLPAAQASIITRIEPDSPAAQAGLDSGDIILKIDHDDATEPQRINRTIAGSAVGSVVQIVVWRDRASLTLPVAIAELPGKGGTSAAAMSVPDAAPPISSHDFGLTFAPITKETRARLGMTDQDTGVLVEDVNIHSVAASRGIAAGAVIVKVDRILITSPMEAHQRLQDATEAFVLLLIRDEQGLRWMMLPSKPA
jgi:serine protease Do